MTAYTRIHMKTIEPGDTVWLGGSILAECTVLWIGPAYEARPWRNAPAHVTECTRDSILKNTRTGALFTYQWRNATAEGSVRLVERRKTA